METRQGKRGRNKKKNNSYGEDFVVDRIVLTELAVSIVGLDEIVVSQEIDQINDTDQDWIDNRSEPELYLTIKDVDLTSIKYISHDNTESNWVAPDGPLRVYESQPSARFWTIDGNVDGYFCPGSGSRTHPHQKSYDQKNKIGKGNRKTGNGGQKRSETAFLGKFSSHILIYRIPTQPTSLSQTVISYSRNVRALQRKPLM